MSTQTAQLIIIVISVAAVIVWGIALRFLQRTDRICRGLADRQADDTDPFTSMKTFGDEDLRAARSGMDGSGEIGDSVADNPYLVRGEEVVNLPVGTLADEIPRQLIQQPAVLGQVKLNEVTARSIEFEGVMSNNYNKHGGPRTFKNGLITLDPLGETQTRVTYRITPVGAGIMLLIGRIINLISLVVIIALGSVLWIFVAGNEEPAIRVQSVQMFQVIHFLWPPFLFAGLARILRKRLEQGIKTMINNIMVLSRMK